MFCSLKKMDLGRLKSDRFAPDIVAFWCSCVFSEFYSSSIPLHLLKPRILISVIHSAISNTNKICIKHVSNACPRTTNITALFTGWKFICRKTSYFWWNAFQYINLLGRNSPRIFSKFNQTLVQAIVKRWISSTTLPICASRVSYSLIRELSESKLVSNCDTSMPST